MKQPISLPPDLTVGEIATRLKVSYEKAWQLCTQNGYKPRKYNHTGLTDEQTIEVLKLHSHETLATVAGILGVSRQRAHQIYRQHRIPRTNHKFGGHNYPKKIK